MTRGILIFAFSNTQIDYLEQANWVADRVNTYLNLPVTIVTNSSSLGDKIITHNLVITDAMTGGMRNFDHLSDDRTDNWFNANRFQSYELSPYDETIVIDSDYVVNSDQLLKVFGSKHDVLCHRDVYDITLRGAFKPFYDFGQHKFPHYWATVLYFKKTIFSKQLFDVMKMIQDNYKHYADLYKFRTTPFRNDYVISISLSIMHGHRLNNIPTIPWKIPTASTDVDLKQLSDTKFEISYKKYINHKEKPCRAILDGTDFHFLNKFALYEVIND